MSLEEYTTENERKIISKLVDDVLAAGCAVSVQDGEEWVVRLSTDKATILGAMATTDRDTLAFYRDSKCVGWVALIYGNDCDIISDYSANAETDAIVAGAEALAETLG